MDTVPRARGRWLMPALWILMTVALAFVLPRLPWERALALATTLDPGWVMLAVLANFAILPVWAIEWRLLVPGTTRVAFPRMFEIVSLTAAVLNSVPMLAGEISAVALLVTRGGLGQGAAVSVLAMDQLLVAFAKVAVLVVAAIVAPMPDWLQGGLLTLGAVLLAMLCGLLLLAHRWSQLRDRLRSDGSASGRMLARAAAWGQHLDTLRSPSLAARVAALALAKKGLEVSAVLAVQAAFGMTLSPATAVLIVAALSLSTLVPVAPGNLGVYEATVFAVYRLAGVPVESALALAVVQHLCFLIPSLATGYVILTARQLARRPRQAELPARTRADAVTAHSANRSATGPRTPATDAAEATRR